MGVTQTTPFVWYGDMRSVTGLPGQNSQTPLAKVFKDHVILRPAYGPADDVSGPYYDPSYGQIYTSGKHFQDVAVAAFGYPHKFVGTDPKTGEPMPGTLFHVRRVDPLLPYVKIEKQGK
jgi:hypothetical protein